MRECHEYIDLLTAQLDGQISEAEERELFEHLLACPECRMIQADLLELSDTLSEMQVTPPADLSERIMSAVAAEKKAKIIPFYKRKNFLSSVITAAAMFAILVVVGGNLNHLLGGNSAPIPAAPAAAAPTAATAQAPEAPPASAGTESAPAPSLYSGNEVATQGIDPLLTDLNPAAGRTAFDADATVGRGEDGTQFTSAAPTPAAPVPIVIAPEPQVTPPTFTPPPTEEPVDPPPEPLPVDTPAPEESTPTPEPTPEAPLSVGEITFYLTELPLPAFLAEIGVPEPVEGLESCRIILTESEYYIIELQFIANNLVYSSVTEGPGFSPGGTVGAVHVIYDVELPEPSEEPEAP